MGQIFYEMDLAVTRVPITDFKIIRCDFSATPQLYGKKKWKTRRTREVKFKIYKLRRPHATVEADFVFEFKCPQLRLGDLVVFLRTLESPFENEKYFLVTSKVDDVVTVQNAARNQGRSFSFWMYEAVGLVAHTKEAKK